LIPVPLGTVLVADRDTRSYDGGRVLVGSSPVRALRLTESGGARARALLDGTPVADDVAAALARRLLDAGLAHPAPRPPSTSPLDVAVPAYGVTHLVACLASLTNVTVVDDGSPDCEAVATIAGHAGARVVRLAANRGPAAARNAGLAATTGPVVAFVDSDAEVGMQTLAQLAAMLDDPAVAAVAPRIHPPGTRLDMGDRPRAVRPGSRTAYVPSTVLVVRRSALDAVGGFDETLRVGEDVDLTWRLVAAGWTVRYVPELVARHHEPPTWVARTDRSRRYGTSAGLLARRHPGAGAAALSPPIAHVAGIGLALAGRPQLAAAVHAASAVGPYRRMRRAGVPRRDATAILGGATARATSYTARWTAQLWSPLVVAAGVRAWHRGNRVRAFAVTAAVLGRRTAIDDLAYGVGVWSGCVRARSFRPLVPRFTRR
jgi:mycofactocin glycosyltransferase